MSDVNDGAKAFYRPELDALRFFAVLAVFWHHILPKTPEFYSLHHVPVALLYSVLGGSFGVQLFFCLSAYLITELLLRERERTCSVHLKSFYIRRILRIWPAYFLVLFICVVAGVFFPSEHVRPASLAAYLLLMGNWANFFLGDPTPFMAPLWSISVEEQFYLLWPLFVKRNATRRRMIFAGAALIAIGVLSRYMAVHHVRNAADFVWNSTLTLLDPIGAGILIAVLLQHQLPKISGGLRLAMFLAGIGLWLLGGRYSQHLQLSLPLATLGSVVMLLAVLGSNAAMPKNRLLIQLGVVSYGMYLYQAIVIETTPHVIRLQHYSLPQFVLFAMISFAITVGLALLSYAYFERPFLRLKERFTFIRSRPV